MLCQEARCSKFENVGKRRTKKEKQRARHEFSLSWSNEASVKGQFNSEADTRRAKPDRPESAKITANDASLKPLKRNIIKSLAIASLILALEVVLYLAWT
jgi:hypothetical protein